MLARTLISRPNVELLRASPEIGWDNTNQDDPKKREAEIDALTKAIKMTPGGVGTNIYALSYRDTDPQRAERLVAQLVKMFVNSGSDNKRKDSQDARSFIEEEIREHEAKLVVSENRAQGLQAEELRRHGRVQPGLLLPHVRTVRRGQQAAPGVQRGRAIARCLEARTLLRSTATARPGAGHPGRARAGSPGLRIRAAPGGRSQAARRTAAPLHRRAPRRGQHPAHHRPARSAKAPGSGRASGARWPPKAPKERPRWPPRPPTRCSSRCASRWLRPRPMWPRCGCAWAPSRPG